eukprot:m.2361 g.2361  ORF g.2361 m.2361 type:complete len:130 (+) comp764_c0_seq2:75-464(+)
MSDNPEYNSEPTHTPTSDVEQERSDPGSDQPHGHAQPAQRVGGMRVAKGVVPSHTQKSGIQGTAAHLAQAEHLDTKLAEAIEHLPQKHDLFEKERHEHYNSKPMHQPIPHNQDFTSGHNWLTQPRKHNN